jgi:ABC-type Fe3+/spermidine/putrescine transport system ATPase subunit
MNHGKVEQVDSPVQLYESPRTRFVASFIGKTNLLAGRKRNGHVVVGEVALPAAALGLAEANDGDVTLSLRPQHVELLPAPAAEAKDGVVAGRVTDAAYLGGFWEYTVDAGMGAPILAVSHAPQVFQRGEAVSAAIALSRIAVIDAP